MFSCIYQAGGVWNTGEGPWGLEETGFQLDLQIISLNADLGEFPDQQPTMTDTMNSGVNEHNKC